MDYDFIESLKVEELKNFLKLRGLKVSGRKKELIARVFCAQEMNVPVVKSAVEVEAELKEQYEMKLVIDNKSLTDPWKLENDWLDEDASCSL